MEVQCRPCDNGGVNHQKIQLHAYNLWQERGQPWGSPETDWFKAEQELTEPKGALARAAREAGSAIGSVVAFVKDKSVLPQ